MQRWTFLKHSRSVEEVFDPRAVLDELAEGALDPELRDEGAATVAMAWALTHDRIVDQLHGHQVHKRFPMHGLEGRAPW